MSTAAIVRNAIRDAIERIGERVALVRRGERMGSFPASIQPRFSAGADASGPAGWGGAGRYMLYAPFDSPAITAGDEIIVRGRAYHVTQSEDFYLSGELLYRQAKLFGEDDTSCKA